MFSRASKKTSKYLLARMQMWQSQTNEQITNELSWACLSPNRRGPLEKKKKKKSTKCFQILRFDVALLMLILLCTKTYN